jgi:hypothetical protein
VAQVPVEFVKQMPMVEFVPRHCSSTVRFGRWQILRQPAPSEELQYTTALWHYVRGLAFVATGNIKDAVIKQVKVDEIAAAHRLTV